MNKRKVAVSNKDCKFTMGIEGQRSLNQITIELVGFSRSRNHSGNDAKAISCSSISNLMTLTSYYTSQGSFIISFPSPNLFLLDCFTLLSCICNLVHLMFILQVWTNGITHPKWKGSMVEEMKCFIKITFAKRWLSKGTNVTLGCKWMFIVSSLTDLWILGSHDTVRLYRQSQSDHSLLFKHLG